MNKTRLPREVMAKFRFLVALAAEARSEHLDSALPLTRAAFAEGRKVGLGAREVADRLVERTEVERFLLARAEGRL